MRELSCTESVELGAEIALGVADAEDRAAVLVHVERCAACATFLRSMTDVADGLTALVPPSPPPAGFEARVLDAITDASDPAPPRTRLKRLPVRPVAAAAAVVVAAVLAVGGWLVGERSFTPSVPVVTAPLVSHRTTVGQVVVALGSHPWISMTVHLQARRALVWCEVREDDGALRTLGTFTIVDGHGYWAAPLPHGTAVRAATLVMSDGQVLATARLQRR